MFTFISYWRTAAVVLCDLASTAYYIGGIVEQAIGPAAPWFILAVMLFSYAVRSVYIESCSSVFVRGGVYRVVKEAMGGFLAKLSVSALMFDYVLTGPISGVSAGQYLMGLSLELFSLFTSHKLDPATQDTWKAWGAVVPGLAPVTLYFFRQNLLGIHEASGKALKIMAATTVMAVVLLTWCGVTLLFRPLNSVPLTPDFHQTPDPLGFLGGTAAGEHIRGLHGLDFLSLIGVIGLFIAFGHSILAMSGEETLAQVYREVEAPKLPNFKKAAFIVFVYSLVLTGGISFLAVLLIPNDVRMKDFADNLIGGLAMNVAGPIERGRAARLRGGGRLSDPGRGGEHGHRRLQRRLEPRGRGRRPVRLVFGPAPALRHDAPSAVPDRRPATGHDPHQPRRRADAGRGVCVRRRLELRVQGVGNGGAVRFQGPAGARVQGAAQRPYRPLRVPIGLGLIFLILLVAAVMNLLTKQTATEWGLGFTVGFMVLFLVSERYTRRQGEPAVHEHLEQFNQQAAAELTPAALGLTKPRCVLVAVRSTQHLEMLDKALAEADRQTTDVVVIHAKLSPPVPPDAPPVPLDTHERRLLTAVVERAEKLGIEVLAGGVADQPAVARDPQGGEGPQGPSGVAAGVEKLVCRRRDVGRVAVVQRPRSTAAHRGLLASAVRRPSEPLDSAPRVAGDGGQVGVGQRYYARRVDRLRRGGVLAD